MGLKTYTVQLLIGIDQLANCCLGGWPDETLSARAWRQHQRKRRWALSRRAIDALFFWQHDHCRQAYLAEALRRQAPPELRSWSSQSTPG